MRVLTSASAGATQIGAVIADRLDVRPESDAAWGAFGDTITTAWERAVARGGTVVIICARPAIREVLRFVLGMPRERSTWLACVPGSLTAVEAWPGGEAVVAFTNRT